MTNYGTPATYAIRTDSQNGSAGDKRGLILENTIMDKCGKVQIVRRIANSYGRFYRVVMKNNSEYIPQSIRRSIGMNESAGTATGDIAGGDYRIEDSFIEGAVHIGGGTGLTTGSLVFKNSLLNGTTIAGYPSMTKGGYVDASEFDLMFLVSRVPSASDSGQIPGGAITRIVSTRDYATNPHMFFMNAATHTINGAILYIQPNNGTNGDCLMMSPTGLSSHTIVVTNALMLPTTGYEPSCVFMNMTGTAECGGVTCPLITAERNTYMADNKLPSGVSGEGSQGHPGIFVSVQNNLVWKKTSGIGYVTAFLKDVVLATGTWVTADYNWYHNLTGTRYFDTSGVMSDFQNTPGLNDRSGDPMFRDETRDPIIFANRYDVNVSSLQGVVAKFQPVYMDMALGTSTGDPRYNIQDMYNWIRAGWVSRSSATWTAANDGGHVGGVAPDKTFGVYSSAL